MGENKETEIADEVIQKIKGEEIRKHSEKMLKEAEIIDDSGNLINYSERGRQGYKITKNG